jgi:hypothetical protein
MTADLYLDLKAGSKTKAWSHCVSDGRVNILAVAGVDIE